MKKILSALVMLTVLVLLFAACVTPDPTQPSSSVPTSGSSVSSADQSLSSQPDPEPTGGPQVPSSSASTAPSTEPQPSSTTPAAPTRPTVPVRPTAPTQATTPPTRPTSGTKPTAATQPTVTAPKHLHTDFTASEKSMFLSRFGEVIPFAANDEYYVEEYAYDQEVGLNFYTFGNTQAEYNTYRLAYSGYTFDGTSVDDYGDTWYMYSKNDFYVDLCYYLTEDNSQCLDVYVYVLTDDGGSSSGGNDSNSYLYTDFTEAEKTLLRDQFGTVIPFVANNKYYVDEYTYEEETGLNFYTYGNTQAEFDAYRSAFLGYSFDGTYEDSYGDTWYMYSKNDFYVDLCYYLTEENGYCLDVYIYVYNDDSGSSGGSGGDSSDKDIITNNGSGLPSGTNGIYNVDFTDAEHVKDVTDQGYYLDGCPTKGSPGVLVIPVEFSDITAQSKGYSITALKNAFCKNGVTDYHSVYDYYYTSSYGQLSLDITVLDSWFRPKYDSSYYQNATMDYYGQETPIGDQLILDEALAYLEGIMDLSKFDSDNNEIIDSVVLITTLDVGDDDFHWAYRYWNIYTDDEGYYYSYDGVSANDYLWASYQFLHEDRNSYSNTSGMNTYTYIHEFGHILGADDYYDTEGSNSPMGEADVMDSTAGDHNAFTKFNFGWITNSRLVTTDSSVTLTLENFSKNGDTILLARDWDSKLGAYQEYYILAYYRNTGLNSGEGGYFNEEGIVVYHVDASLYKEVQDGETYYDIYYNNSSSTGELSVENNLIEYVMHSGNRYVYGVGDTLGTVYGHSGNALQYTFTVDALNGDTATVTITRI